MKWSRRLFAAGALALLLLAGLTASAIAQDGAGEEQPGAAPAQINATAAAQMALLQAEKAARTPAEQKLSSHLLLALRRWRNDPLLNALPALHTLSPDAAGRILVDIDLTAAEDLPAVLQLLGQMEAKVIHQSAAQRAVRALMPLDQTVVLAELPAVRNIRAADQAITNSQGAAGPWSIQQVDTSEGDVTHQANLARQLYGVTGAGQKICVLSDGVDSLAAAQASGDLPPVVDVLPGQAGNGDEGTAMLEIVHDLAPGAQLGFATGFDGVASFADNIRALYQDGCTIIVDDISYFIESPFQDNDIAQAVIDVTNAGAMYFSSAANDGNLDSERSGAWEGDFNANGSLGGLPGGSVHNFGDGGQSNQLTAAANLVLLHWADPYGSSANDYDLYVLDASLSNVLASGTDDQNGSGIPYEYVYDALPAGARVVVWRENGAANRMINVLAARSTLQIDTAGATRGHSAAPLAFSVAAVPAAAAFSAGGPTGPYPNAHTTADGVEWFSSDGPRRIFFDFNGALLPGAPAGNYSASGGVVRQKPDIAAADGVQTSAPGFSPFFGTSAAAPHAAAIAGLLKAAFPLSTTLEIRNLLQTTALDIMGPGVDRNTGYGIVMPAPALARGGAQASALLLNAGLVTAEVAGNGNTLIDPAETWQITIPLTNAGGMTATAVSATLTSSTPGVVLLANRSAYPDLRAGSRQVNAAPFVFQLGPEVFCGARLAFTLTVTYADSAPRTSNLAYTLATGVIASTPLTVAYSGPAVPILDPDGDSPITATAALSVTGVPGRIGRLLFSLDGALCTTTRRATTVGVDHTYTGDLIFNLRSPDGAQTAIIERVGRSGVNFCQTVLDDRATVSINALGAADAPFTGVFKPSTPLAAFEAREANGVWQLHVLDQARGDTGNIRAFSLQIWPVLCNVTTGTPQLSGLELNAGVLSPAFAPATTVYTAQLAAAAQTLTLTPTTTWSGVTLLANGAAVTAGDPFTVSLPPGAHREILINLQNEAGVIVNSYRILANRAPRMTGGAWGTRAGTPVTLNVLARSSDADGDSLAVREVQVLTGTQGAVSRNLDGTVTYTPAAGFAGAAVFGFTAEDGQGGAGAAQANVVVGAAGADLPQVTIYDPAQPVTGTLQAANTATVTLGLGAGAYTGTLGAKDLFYLVYTQVLTPAGGAAAPPAGWQSAGQQFTLAGYQNAAALAQVRFGKPITLALHYDPLQNIGSVPPESLELWYWDAAAGQWSQAGLTLLLRDQANHILTYAIDHLTEFAFFGKQVAPRLYLPTVRR
jgi:subtilisin-like proprotein convertase family protein